MEPLLRPDPFPEQIGRYRILGMLGSGGMGEVFLAWDDQLKRHVAIKRLLQGAELSPEQWERFFREAPNAAKVVCHPNVVQIHDLLSEHEAIVMEYIEGRTLAERLAADRLETAQVLRLALEIARGLAAAHEAGLIHRDLKAANVLITRSGEHAKIVDFGLARPEVRLPEDPGLTRKGVVIGTCYAMSPEQVRGEELDKRSDLFSFGSLFHEMLTGHPPFRGKDAIDSLWKVLHEEPVHPQVARRDLPAEAADLLLRLLQKDREERPASAQEVIETLERLQIPSSGPHSVAMDSRAGDYPSDEETLLALPERRKRKRGFAFGSRRGVLVVGAAVLLLFILAAAFFLLQSTKPVRVPAAVSQSEQLRSEQLPPSFIEIQKHIEAGDPRPEDLDELNEMLKSGRQPVEVFVLAARLAYFRFQVQRDRDDLALVSKLVREAKKLKPEDRPILLLDLQLALARRDLNQAKTILGTLDRLAPGNSDTLPLKADLAEQLGKLEDARNELREAVRQNPSWQNRLLLANFEARQGKIASAREQIDAIDARSLTNAWALESVGYFEMVYGDMDKAEKLYERVTGSAGERALTNLAEVSVLRLNFPKAATLYKQALEKNPDHIPLLVNLAEVETALYKDKTGEKHYRDALKKLNDREDKTGLTPSEALMKAQCLVRLDQKREALTIVRPLCENTADDPLVLYQCTLALILAGEQDLAAKEAQAALNKGLAPHWFEGAEFDGLRKDSRLRRWFSKKVEKPG
jgi:serine/threonine-protein kinase